MIANRKKYTTHHTLSGDAYSDVPPVLDCLPTIWSILRQQH